VTLAETQKELGSADPAAAAVGYQEPSLVFLAGTQTLLTNAAAAADFLLQGGCRLAFIESRQERSFARRADAIGLRYAQGPRVEAFNFNSGRAVTITVYYAEAAP
jgi:hypothetical protein